MYHIVEFTSSKEVAVVPSSWVSKDLTICIWPPYKTASKLEVAVKNSEIPTNDWVSFPVRCLKTFGTYEFAVGQLSDAEVTSDLMTEASDAERISCQKRISCHRGQHNLVTSSDSENEEEIPSSLPPAPKIPRVIHVVGKPNSTQSSSASEFLFSDSLHLPLPHLQSNCTCSKVMMNTLHDMQKQLQHNNYLLTQLLANRREATDVPKNLPYDFPFSTPEYLKEFDQCLIDDGTFSSCCRYLATFGGSNFKQTVQYIMKNVMTHEVSLKFNWQGRGDKMAFREFEKINDLIYRVVVKNPRCRTATVAEVESEIKNWLKYAADRNGGRQKRSGVKEI